MLYPIPTTKNGEVVNANTSIPGSNGKFQAQWSDDYLVWSTAEDDGSASKTIFIGSMSIIEGRGWDLENSDLAFQAQFEYHPSAEKTISTGGCEDPIPYDPDFVCNTPISTTTQTQAAETGLLYKNPVGEGARNRPIMDEGWYEHARSTIFRYSSFGDFEDVVTDLDKTSGYHPLTDNRSVVAKHELSKFVPENWWKEPFAIINAKSEGEADNELTHSDGSKEQDPVTLPDSFKKKSADKITNFNPSSDTLEIDTDSFGIDSSATFASGANKKEVKKVFAKQDFDFLYDQKKGGLYFNENGADKGFGDGGIIVILKGAPDLTSDSLEFI